MGIIESIRDRSPHQSGLDHHVQHYWPQGRDRFDPKPPDGRRTPPVVEARINHGRWLVGCPFCTGAQLADPDDHRFFCVDCLMEANGGRWVDVTWPADPVIGVLEGVLGDRPVQANRNWETWENVSMLIAENVMHGVGDPTKAAGSILDEHGSLPLKFDHLGMPLGYPGWVPEEGATWAAHPPEEEG